MTKLESEDAGAAEGGPGGGSSAWPPLLEELLDGVAHQFSNRVALLAGVSELLGQDPTVPPILRALADEVPQLEETIRLLRILATPAETSADPIMPDELIRDASALAVLHRDVKRAHFDAAGAGLMVPVVVARTSAIRAVVRELVTTARPAVLASAEPQVRIPISVVQEGDDVVVRVGHPENGSEDTRVVRWPTLEAVRRREAAE